MKYKRKWMTVTVLLAVFAIVVMLLQGKSDRTDKENKKAEQTQRLDDSVKTESISYEGMGNNQGNIENGGQQTFVSPDKILVEEVLQDSSTEKMFYFDVETQKLRVACDRKNCLHNEKECASNATLRYLQSYSSVFFGVSDSYNDEIWKYENGSVSCFFKSDDDIYGLWAYADFLYYMTDFGVFRVSVQQKSKSQKVLDKPVLYEYLTFDKNKIYFCEENKLLYRANLDGSDKVRLSDKKMLSPQIYQNRIYYRSAEYDKNGKYQMENTLYSMALDGGDRKRVLDGVYQFNVLDNGIYYTELPEEGETTLFFYDFASNTKRKITDCAAAYLYVFEESDWILFEKTEGSLLKGEEGGNPTHLYCMKKDGSKITRLDYPKVLKE